MTEVRFAALPDIPGLVQLGRHMHVQSRYAWMMYSADRAWKYLEGMIPSKQSCVMVALDVTPTGSNACGILIATANPYPFSTDFVAQIDVLYVAPQKRGTATAMKMLTAFRRWANNREVAEITISNRFGAGEAKTTKLFGKLGMPAVGGVHSMWMRRK